MGGLIKKTGFFFVSFSYCETALKFVKKKLKSFLVLSLLSDHIQGNTLKKTFIF